MNKILMNKIFLLFFLAVLLFFLGGCGKEKKIISTVEKFYLYMSKGNLDRLNSTLVPDVKESLFKGDITRFGALEWMIITCESIKKDGGKSNFEVKYLKVNVIEIKEKTAKAEASCFFVYPDADGNYSSKGHKDYYKFIFIMKEIKGKWLIEDIER